MQEASLTSVTIARALFLPSRKCYNVFLLLGLILYRSLIFRKGSLSRDAYVPPPVRSMGIERDWLRAKLLSSACLPIDSSFVSS